MTTHPHTNGLLAQMARIREQANLRIDHELHQIQIEGILPAHGSLLFFLFRQNEPVPMRAIVEQIGRVKSTVTGMIKTLESYGYVEKIPSTEDARVILVQLTEKGCALKNPLVAISDRLISTVYGDMPEADREQLVTLLSQLETNLSTPS